MMLKSLFTALMVALACASAARADGDQDFYRDRTLTLDVGFNPGGAYDVYARLFARHFPRHLVAGGAGAPNVVVRNMPGAGSVITANYLFARAPADGTELGLIAGDAALAPLFAAVATQFDGRKFTWLGSANREAGACFAWRASGVDSARDLFDRGMIVGAAGTSSLLTPTLLNALGAHLKLVRGYAGTSALMLAIERGEVAGMCGVVLAALQTEHPDWLAKGLIRPIMQIGVAPNPVFGDLPMASEFIRDPDGPQLLRLLFGWTIMGRPFLAPPGVPPERARVLRAAFAAMMVDPTFLADAEKSRVEISPIGAEEIADFLRQAYASPELVLTRARAITSASQ